MVGLRVEGRSCWGGMEAGRILSEGCSVGGKVVDDWGNGSSLKRRKRKKRRGQSTRPSSTLVLSA